MFVFVAFILEVGHASLQKKTAGFLKHCLLQLDLVIVNGDPNFTSLRGLSIWIYVIYMYIYIHMYTYIYIYVCACLYCLVHLFSLGNSPQSCFNFARILIKKYSICYILFTNLSASWSFFHSISTDLLYRSSTYLPSGIN